jgi:hypothetical protein
VKGAQLLNRDVLGRLEDPVPNVLRPLDVRVDWRDNTDEYAMARLHVLADDFQDADTGLLPREGDVEIPDHQLEQAG